MSACQPSFCTVLGFALSADGVHLEVRDDRHGSHTGTGVAYVKFVSPQEAERARHVKHKQMMGSRYIECMVFVPGNALTAEKQHHELLATSALHIAKPVKLLPCGDLAKLPRLLPPFSVATLSGTESQNVQQRFKSAKRFISGTASIPL